MQAVKTYHLQIRQRYLVFEREIINNKCSDRSMGSETSRPSNQPTNRQTDMSAHGEVSLPIFKEHKKL